MKQEIDQARGGAMEAQNLSEPVRERAADAKIAATQPEQVRRVMLKLFRHLEPLVCGGSRSATGSREERGP
ncbi:hypothetical protein PF002_g284 [Phytophthora fragariae]|uniref:Uncharacterized protein n=1 Tax=Phytophthora fragariae TaxID=53985 RepID=A0A6A4ANS0_9STRA|nr:hypothetical protein PF002_g284 [Phytophthora fragariae]